MKHTGIKRPPEPHPTSRFDIKVQWLLECYGLSGATNKVVDLFATEPPFEWSFEGFKNAYSYMWEWRAVQGRAKKIRAVDEWKDEQPTLIGGIAMRPDQLFPAYQVNGVWWKNTFAPTTWDRVPILRVRPFVRFIRRLIPDIDECEYFLDCIAHKLRRPDVPGPSIVMVAVDENDKPLHGTGRGTLTKVLQALFGHRYIKTVPFETFAGMNSQSQFSASWQAGSLIVCVDEAKAIDVNSYTGRRGIYENIKALVDPGKTIRTLTDKRIPYFDTWVFSSYLIYSNHVDALQLPTDDERRFYVLKNGRKPTPAESREIIDWIADEDNIAALVQWLALRSLSKFDPHTTPPQTAAKDDMQAVSKSDMEEAFDMAERYMPGIAMHGAQLRNWVACYLEDVATIRSPAYGAVKRMRTKSVLAPPDFRKVQRQVRMGGASEHPKKVIAFVGNRKKAQLLDLPELKAQIRLNDATPSSTPRLTSILGGKAGKPAATQAESFGDDEI